ncbi:MAG TPA: DUF2231 domain-containing protein, partial [Gemmataceae bacterium]|nr:DUF2231 domain-containing protein [Gemmataceae bacterium]
ESGYDERTRHREEPRENPLAAEPAEAMPPRAFRESLIGWLGKYHPPAVHFPIALLTAAAVAEMLQVVTGKPFFDAVSRFCVWFGTLAAAGAGILGCFAGGVRLIDDYWVMTTHRWLGTSTVTCAGLALALSEMSRQPDRRRTRTCFRVVLLASAFLALATGFFGGAVVYGLEHYAWPQ